MYEEFLDKRMQYSCAFWENPEQSLEEAQQNKMRRLLDSLNLQPGMELLEVGSGWGYLARMAAEEYGAKVTSVTLSQEQLNYAQNHVQEAGLDNQIEFRLQDYREVEGQFDRIVSVEMIEAVGHENLGTYFSSLEKNLKEDGKIAIQVITVPDQKYATYVQDCDWIQKYIFPGALCPSLGAMVEAMSKSSRLWLESTENIGAHYARTLYEWRVNFESNWENIKKLGFDEKFRRLWNYYLIYCEAGYRAGILGNHQLVLSKTSRKVPMGY
jgi:cyclopropane-fatty-acyl-phospholipid synthase